MARLHIHADALWIQLLTRSLRGDVEVADYDSDLAAQVWAVDVTDNIVPYVQHLVAESPHATLAG